MADLPYVMVAVFCENYEKDGGVISIRRIVDTYFVDLDQVPEGQLAVLEVRGIIGFKSPKKKTEGMLSFRLRVPNGTVVNPGDRRPFMVSGEESGSVMFMTFNVLIPVYGVYWMDVLWDDERITSMPLRITQRAPTPQSAPVQTASP